MNNKEIHELIKLVNELGVKEVNVEKKDFKLNIVGHSDPIVGSVAPVAIQAAAPAPVAAASTPAAPVTPAADASAENDNLITIKSPMIGTFYRKPSPDKSSYVNIGDTISEGDTLCIVEAMKLFNEIEAEVSGKIVKVLIDDMSPVEFDQPLFLVEPN